MKIYAKDSQMCLVGKGWEIRHYLQKVAGQADSHTRLNDYLIDHVIKPSRARSQKSVKRWAKLYSSLGLARRAR
ncbi:MULTISPECIES: Z-ring formation inhibitor MciZ [unclassified Paenibacillus]|uniref:Z-ring formation inhibitor MciZ n=1 Tax=unclassified Paenibacillus TaxID=185978 RepID=UPI0015A076B1|nr:MULTISPECIES: Z-ring formation inhibitor MciZ [unclassified Paenibacillus]